MKYVTTQQMKRLDQIAIERYGVPSLVLMENAGRGIAEFAEEMLGVAPYRHCEEAVEIPRPSLRAPRSGAKQSPGLGQAPQSQRLLCRTDRPALEDQAAVHRSTNRRQRFGALPRNDRRKYRILVVVGKGNNGGDGMVAARHLANRGYTVHVILLASPRDLKDDPKMNYQILKKMRVPIQRVVSYTKLKKLKSVVRKSNLILDGIFGIGLKRIVDGFFRDVISILNHSEKPILAIDIPSGLDSDSGKELGIAIRARATGTLGAPKRGLFVNEGPNHAGRVSTIDISIPAVIAKQHPK